MSLREDMLRAAARAPEVLPAAARAAAFLRAARRPDGGFPDRSGASDLYYTVFALQGLAALGQAADDASAAARYLRTFGDGAALDFVHRSCLARCWSLLAPSGPAADVRRGLLAHLEAHRSADGGYHPTPGARAGTAYACFLALGAHQDLGAPMPDAAGLARCLGSLRSADGGCANEPAAARGSTAATAAAVLVLRELGEPVDPAAGAWLLAQMCPEGGFRAMPAAPIPDLLSTATALHALAAAGMPLDADRRRACIAFVEGLWSDEGGFRGHWADDAVDCEYTFYGLLALGHLGTP